MVVYLLYSSWMHNGDNAVNEVIGVYDCLQKAQHSLCECIFSDLVSHPFEHIWGDCECRIDKYDILSLVEMDYNDDLFKFDVRSARLWNGEEEITEDYQYYNIEEKEVF